MPERAHRNERNVSTTPGMLIWNLILSATVLVMLSGVGIAEASYNPGAPPPGFAPRHPASSSSSQQQQQQQQQQQRVQGQGGYGQGQGGHGRGQGQRQGVPPGYGQGQRQGYGQGATGQQRPPPSFGQGQGQVMPYRGPPQQHDGGGQLGGFFSKMKNKIFEGAAAFAGTENMHPTSSEHRKQSGPSGQGNYPPSRGPPGSMGGFRGSHGQPLPGMEPAPSGMYGSPSPRSGAPADPGQEEGGNFWGKLKGFFSDGEDEHQQGRAGYGGSGGRPGLSMGPGFPSRGGIPAGVPPPGYGGTGSYGTGSGSGSGSGTAPAPSQPSHQPGAGDAPWGDGRVSKSMQKVDTPAEPYGGMPPPPPPHLPWGDEPVVQDIPSRYGSEHFEGPAFGMPPSDGFGDRNPFDSMSGVHHQEMGGDGGHPSDGYPGSFDNDPFFNYGAEVPVEEPAISPEPQIFVVEDCIVLIPRPAEFYKKKMDIFQAGPQSLQVFTDYERCLTRFRTDEGEKSMGTAELLESSSVLMPAALDKIKTVIDDFADMGAEGATYDAEENFTAERERVIALDGQLHMANIAPATRDMLPRMPLREGWRDVFHSLARKGVPTYVFSDGYGDIVQQALLLNGGFDGGGLPQNIRIISNMFRTAPDGTVRAFSHPVVHSRNKNVTTAASVMGFPIPNRPYALLVGAHENDLGMLSGMEGLKDKMSLGFLEMTTDLTERLPLFLESYDIVVLGDGSFQYIKSLVDELLEPPEVDLRGMIGSQAPHQQFHSRGHTWQ